MRNERNLASNTVQQNRNDLYHIYYNYILDNKVHRASFLAKFMDVDPKTVKRRMQNVDGPDRSYWNEHGDYSVEGMEKLKEKMRSFFKSCAKIECLTEDFYKTIRKIHPDYLRYVDFFCTNKKTLDVKDEIYYAFYTKGYEYYIRQMVIISQIWHTVYVKDKEKYNTLVSQLSLPFTFSHNVFWECIVKKENTEDAKILYRQCRLFFIVNIDIFFLTPFVYRKNDKLGTSNILEGLKYRIEHNKSTMRYFFFEEIKEKIFNSSMYNKFCKRLRKNYTPRTLDSLYEFFAQKDTKTTDRIRKLCGNIKKNEDVTSEALYKFAEMCSTSLYEDSGAKEHFIEQIRNSFLICCIVDKIYNDDFNHVIDCQNFINQLYTWQEWLCVHVYNCPVPQVEQGN